MKRGKFRLKAVLLYFFLVISASSLHALVDNRGTEFWIGFMTNYDGTETINLIITSEIAAAGTVSVPGLTWSAGFTTTPGTATTITLPAGAHATGIDTVGNVGVHVTSDNEISVYGLSQKTFSTDAYLALPVDAIGYDYIVVAYANGGWGGGTEFMVVASQDNTLVTIIPSVTTNGRTAGVPYNITLNSGQVYQLVNTAVNTYATDLTGTFVSADKPVAVFGGHKCADIPSDIIPYKGACDHIVEQLPPAIAWGTKFLGMPLKTRLLPDTFVIVASQDNTSVDFSGTPLGLLNRGQKIQVKNIAGPISITSDKPVLAAQYSNGMVYDGVGMADPFMMLLLPEGQYQDSYTIATPSNGIDFNYLNLVVQAADINSIILDGMPVSSTAFVPIPGSSYYGCQLNVPIGVHNVSGPSPFGIYVYGFDSADSYGYPGGCGVQNLMYTPTNSPTESPTFTISQTHTVSPTFTVTHTVTKTCTPTFTSTATPTVTPSVTPTSTPRPLVLTSPGSFPNPFEWETQIVYWLSTEATVSLKIFTVSGETVHEAGGLKGLMGNNAYYWDGRKKKGVIVASGVFLCKISAVSPRNEHASVIIKLARVK